MAKPALILLHGMLCDARVWEDLRAALEEDFTIRVPDLRGPDSFHAMAEGVLARAPARFHLAGHSMGARVAMELLDLAPARVQRLALLDFGAHPVDAAEPARRQALLDLLARGGLAAVADSLIEPMFHAHSRRDAALLDAFRAMALRTGEAAFRGQIHAALTRRDQRPLLARASQEILLACGAEDAWSTVAQHRALLPLLRHGRLEVVADAGHMLPMERPADCARLLRSFLAGDTPAADALA